VAGEPVAYLTGTRAFYDRDLVVTPAVLIPRPETEHLVEAALAWARGLAPERQRGLRIADVGTGSGAIAVTLAAHLPGAQVWAVDISAEALAVAAQNAARHGVTGHLILVEGDLLAQVPPVDLIAANLPYVPRAKLAALPVTRHEPWLALDGGPDGLDLIRRLLAQAPAVLAAGGLALLEIEAGQGPAVRALAEAAFPGAAVAVLTDWTGHDRLVRIERGE
jgi:release factor glutamine methyltransferase